MLSAWLEAIADATAAAVVNLKGERVVFRKKINFTFFLIHAKQSKSKLKTAPVPLVKI